MHTTSAAIDPDDLFADFFGMPGLQHEFRFEVGSGATQCYFQKLRQNAQFHMSFEVLRGADRNINVMVRKEDGTTFEEFQWINEGNLDRIIETTGVYSFCFDNSLSRFTSKLVYVYLLSYTEEDWRSYAKEMQDYHSEVENVSKSLELIDQRANKILVMQASTRRHVLSDYYTITGNNDSVRRWSFVMCIVIVASSLFQVYFVRRLVNVHGTGVRSVSKPRA
jgi:protein ERP2